MTRDGTASPFRETKFSGANGDRKIFKFPVQLITSRIGNLTRLILTLCLLYVIPYNNTYIHTFYGMYPTTILDFDGVM